MSSGTGFEDVDGAADPTRLTAYLEAVGRDATMTAGKRRRDDWLDPRPGSRLLDLGCGLGDDARALASRVRPGGRVVGVDSSSRIIEAARTRTAGQPSLEFVRADGRALPFAPATFDGARVERLLQHVADPDAIVDELVRVVRPGGVIVCAEPDWGMVAIDSDERDMADALVGAYAAAIRQPWIGRSLRRRLLAAGLVDVEVAVEPHIETSTKQLPIDLEGLAARAHAAGLADAEEAMAFSARLREAEREGRFLLVVTMFAARGRVASAA